MQITAAVTRDGAPAPMLETIELGEPRADEILVRVVAAGVCHTDLRMQGPKGRTPKPVVLGHEGAGIVEKVGSAVLDIKPGDHVVLSGSSCGQCPSCRANAPSYCHEVMPRSFGGARMDGSSALSQNGAPLHGHFFGQSSFATYAIADAKGAVVVDKDVPLDIVAPLGCGIITGAGAVFYSFGVKPGQSIAIFGTGSVGLSAVMAAKLSGAQTIIAVDPIAERRALAVELGATHSIDPAAGDVTEAVRAFVPDGVRFALNTTNVAPVYQASLEVLGMQGEAAFVTALPKPLPVNLQHLLSGGRALRGIIQGSAAPRLAIPMMIDYWRQGRFPIDRLIKHYDFADIATAFADCEAGRTIKPVLRMG